MMACHRAILAILVVVGGVAAADATLVAQLERLAELRDQGALTPSEFTAAKAWIVGAPAVDTTEAELTAAVSKIMLGEQMAELLTGIFRGQAGALKAEIAEVKSMVDGVQQPAAGAVARRLEGNAAAVCTLAGCGEDDACSAWNDKELENTDDCQQCASKKYSVNTLHGCSCAYTCVVPAAEASAAAPAEAAATPADAGAVSANVASATVWLEDEEAKLAFGEQGDVAIQKVADGLRVANANMTVDGEVTIQGGTRVSEALAQLRGDVATLDSVAVKSSSAGTQTLGEITATSLVLSHGVQLGTNEMPCSDASHGGSLKWNAASKRVEVCDGSGTWVPIYEPPLGTKSNPASSCKAILQDNAASGDGIYWVTNSVKDKHEAYCDQTGGGWTLLSYFGSTDAYGLGSGLRTLADMRAAGWTIETDGCCSNYGPTEFRSQSLNFHSSGPKVGKIKLVLPRNTNGGGGEVRVKYAHVYSGGAALLYIGGTEVSRKQGSCGSTKCDTVYEGSYNNNDELMLEESQGTSVAAIFWVFYRF